MGSLDIALKSMMVALLYFGGHLVRSNNLTAGQLTQFSLHTAMIAMGLYGLNSIYMDSTEAWQSAARIVECTRESSARVLSTASAQITFENVCVRYDGESEDALRNASFTVNAGDVIGLVGESGAGKSTLVGVLTGEVQPTSGTVYVNGKAVAYAEGECVSDLVKVHWHPQQPVLFGRSIRDGLQLGGDASEEEVRAALERAQVTDFCSEANLDMPLKIEGNGGTQFSGGETARLCLARALCGKSALLLLDEPCAGLDGPTAQEVAKSFYNRESTCVIASHNIQALEQATCIYVLVNGEIVEQLPYKQLKVESKEFARLVRPA